MASAFASSTHPASEQRQNRMIFGAAVVITLLRSVALVVTPLDLGVDEAQYWLWSQTPDFGYFTKPPLIAWIIAAAHWLFGHHTWAVRLPACWIHLGTALLLWRAASWLYGQQAGRLAALIWITLPATGLGSFLISTDTPLLALWSAGAFGDVRHRQRAAVCRHWHDPCRAGFWSGHAGQIRCHLRSGRGAFNHAAWLFAPAASAALAHFVLAVIAFGLAASPNIIWNFANEFATVRHLGDNANISQHAASLAGVWQFIGSQFAVAGPLMLVFMLVAAGRSQRNQKTGWLVWMWAPVFALMTVQSYLSEANANWAMTAFPALTLVAAGWLSGHKKRFLRITAIGINLGLSLFVLLVTMAGSMGPLTPQSDPLRRLRGWQQLATDIRPQIAAHDASAIIADRRATAALLNWHFYDSGLTIMVHDTDGVPSNHFEANHYWSAQPGRRLIALTGDSAPPPIPGVKWIAPTATSQMKSHMTSQGDNQSQQTTPIEHLSRH
jgi:4-amino-4-deoxy-L-arabinose transferase-like glycosyltransferase